jgi:tRNA A-37 threonylcarbamoyl transferase component Bud32
VPISDLQKTLVDLPRFGTLVKDRGYRQVWRFVHEGQVYFLKFYPKGGPRDRFRRFFRGSPAMREFTRLQSLQKADVPAPRAVAVMLGFTLDGRRGDVVILNAIEPSVQLDHYLHDLEINGNPIPNHLELSKQVCELVLRLGQARLGHTDLHLGNFLMHDGKLFLLDGYAVRTGGMKMRDLMMLGHSARRFATLSDVLRGWAMLGPGGPPPNRNSLSEFLWKRFLQGITKENRYFGKLKVDGWRGIYTKRTKFPFRWSKASALQITVEDWREQLPGLLKQIEEDKLQVIKRSRSGDVLAGEVRIAGQTLPIIVKRPRRRYWYRYLNEIGRGSRPWRAWKKAWNLLVRGVPTAWPLLVLEHRSFGYVTDALFICERVPGKTMARVDLAGFSEDARQSLMHRTGHLLRTIEKHSFSHFDAKASNWIVFEDEKLGPTPILVDVDGIRRRRWVGLGIERLLRSMHENKVYSPQDSLWLCRGYSPASRVQQSTETSEEMANGKW